MAHNVNVLALDPRTRPYRPLDQEFFLVKDFFCADVPQNFLACLEVNGAEVSYFLFDANRLA